MKVYVVPCWVEEIFGIYSSLDKAKEAVKISFEEDGICSEEHIKAYELDKNEGDENR